MTIWSLVETSYQCKGAKERDLAKELIFIIVFLFVWATKRWCPLFISIQMSLSINEVYNESKINYKQFPASQLWVSDNCSQCCWENWQNRHHDEEWRIKNKDGGKWWWWWWRWWWVTIASQPCNLKREDWHRGMEDFNRLNCYKYTKREGTNTGYNCYKYTLIVYK